MTDLDKLEKKLRKRIKDFDKKYAAAKTRLHLAIKIAEEREKAGITQKEFAKRLRTTQSVVHVLKTADRIFLSICSRR